MGAEATWQSFPQYHTSLHPAHRCISGNVRVSVGHHIANSQDDRTTYASTRHRIADVKKRRQGGCDLHVRLSVGPELCAARTLLRI
eukprot:2169321-Rhodomonas_salina.6